MLGVAKKQQQRDLIQETIGLPNRIQREPQTAIVRNFIKLRSPFLRVLRKNLKKMTHNLS